jgi:hypothetical protein
MEDAWRTQLEARQSKRADAVPPRNWRMRSVRILAACALAAALLTWFVDVVSGEGF